jgi:hypothetical protein
VTTRDAFGNPIEEPSTPALPRPATSHRAEKAAASDAFGHVPPLAAAPRPLSGSPSSDAPASDQAAALAAALHAMAATRAGGGEPRSSAPPLRVPASPALPVFYPPSPRRRRGWGVASVITLLVLGGCAGAAFLVVDSAPDRVRPAVDLVRSVREEAAKVAQPAPVPPQAPRGLQQRSLLNAPAFGALLARAARDHGGRVTILRLAPERANLQLVRGSGLDLVQVAWDGATSKVRTPAGGDTGHAPIRLADVDRRAPARLVRAAAARLHRTASSVDYLVLLRVLDRPRWSAYFHGGAAFTADAHGRHAHRIA